MVLVEFSGSCSACTAIDDVITETQFNLNNEVQPIGLSYSNSMLIEGVSQTQTQTQPWNSAVYHYRKYLCTYSRSTSLYTIVTWQEGSVWRSARRPNRSSGCCRTCQRERNRQEGSQCSAEFLSACLRFFLSCKCKWLTEWKLISKEAPCMNQDDILCILLLFRSRRNVALT